MNNKNIQEHQRVDILVPIESDISNMVSFFVDQIGELRERQLCTEEEEKEYIDWHTAESLREKISDPTRFFRLIRDTSGNLIAYFESKQHGQYHDTQVVQWILIDELHRNTGLSKILRREFYNWCQSHGYMSTWTYVHQNNAESQAAHENLGELRMRVGEKTLFVLGLQ